MFVCACVCMRGGESTCQCCVCVWCAMCLDCHGSSEHVRVSIMSFSRVGHVYVIFWLTDISLSFSEKDLKYVKFAQIS